MDNSTARALSSMNTLFYEEVSASFSNTRSSAWPGWAALVKKLADLGFFKDKQNGEAMRVLDVACGNMRFERFIKDALPSGCIAYTGIDNCQPLLNEGSTDHFVKLDLIDLLLNGNSPSIPCEQGDLVTCFGFFHHIPGAENRRRFLEILSTCVSGEGMLAISLWRFLDDRKLAAKATEMQHAGEGLLHELGGSPSELEENDCFLPWQETEGAIRYCHHFGEEDIEDLASQAPSELKLIDRFLADGKSGELNCYLVFKKTSE